jgi:tetratricopeptide (TPR) repeat protein
MALRAVTLTPAARRLTLNKDGWRKQVETTLTQASEAVRRDDLETVSKIFDELETWGDEQRAYQARRQLVELAFTAADSMRLDRWIELYLVVAGKVLDELERNAAEPVLLNYSGVLLFEVGETGAADALFAVAQRLDPELDHVRENRKAARRRRRNNKAVVLPAHLRPRARGLGAQAKNVARKAAPAQGQTLSLVMIVKNEEEMLPGCLEAVRGAVDEIVVVDTGSTDRTVEIAESFGAKVVEFPWNGSFADARNCSLDHATGDWIVYLDADEHLVPEDAPRLRELVARSWREAFYLAETNYTGGEESGSSVAHLALRVFKRKPEYRFEGRIHEQKTQAMPTYLPERFETTDIRIRHYGYLKSRIFSKEKSRRNIELLEAEVKEAPGPFVDFNLGSEYMSLGDFERACEYLDRAWDSVRAESGWSGKGYAPMLASRVVQSRREAGNVPGARIAIDEGLKHYPDNTELVLQWALCAEVEGDLGEAVRLAERCLEMGEAPTRYSATVGCGTYLAQCLLAQLRTKQGDPLAAEELYRSVLEEYPDYVAPVLPLAASMLERGVAPADVSAAVPAERSTSQLLLATALYEAGHSPEAESGFRAVLARQPEHSVARIGLVETLLARKAYDEAAAEAVQEPDGSSLEAAAMGAELFARAAARKTEELRAGIDRARGRGVSAAELALYTAWASALEGETRLPVVPGEAITPALTALEALLRVQEFAVFETLLAVFRRIDVDPRESREALARIYFRRGYLESAFDEWADAYDAGPDSRTLVGLAQCAFARGMTSEAKELAAEAVRLEPVDPRAERLVAALAAR